MTASLKIKTIDYLSLIPFLLLLATVWVVDYDLANPTVSGKYFWFYITTGICSITAFFSIILTKKNFQISLMDILMLIYGISVLSFSFFHPGYFKITTKYILFALLFVLYYIFRVFFQNNKKAPLHLLFFLVITGLVEAIWGLLQLYGLALSHHAVFTMTGSFFNPGPFGGYLSIILPIAFYFVLQDSICLKVKFRIRYWYHYLRGGISFLAIIGILSVLPAVMGRAAWLSGLGSCGLAAFFYFSGQRRIRNHFEQAKKISADRFGNLPRIGIGTYRNVLFKKGFGRWACPDLENFPANPDPSPTQSGKRNFVS